MSSQQTKTKVDRPVDLRWFVDKLYKKSRITRQQLEKVLSVRRSEDQQHQHVLAFLASFQLPDQAHPGKKLDIETLTQFLADLAGQPYMRIDPLSIDAVSVTEVMSHAFTQRHKIMAVKVAPDEVTVASAEPFVSKWELDLGHVLKKPIRRVVVNPVELQRLTDELYRLSSSISFATDKGKAGQKGPANLEQMLELGRLKDPEANDQHIVSIVDWLLNYAFEQRASDIHIEPRREVGNIRFRIDGVLYTVYQIPMQVLNAVTSRLKVLGRMNVAEKRKPQDGRLKTKTPEGTEVELRLSTLPTAFGEKMVLRIFDPDVLLKSFEDLGLVNGDLQRWKEIISHRNGIVLITGPTGSGKTTSLYSTLKTLATKEVNVCTVEDPIEMVESAFNQMQVHESIGLDFASGIRALLRQDPDIIMVGEIRDLETAEMAIKAALTGHLVFSTLHTNDAPSAIARLLELGVAPYLIRATLVGVMAQRLVRVLCPHCKQSEEIGEQEWEALVSPWPIEKPELVYTATGCRECRDTGYQGREGIYEVMPFTDRLQKYSEHKSDLPVLRQQAYQEGMKSLKSSGAEKVAAGKTTVQEILRVAPD